MNKRTMPCPICHGPIPSHPCTELISHSCAIAMKNKQDAFNDDLIFFDNLGFIERVPKGWRTISNDKFMPQHSPNSILIEK